MLWQVGVTRLIPRPNLLEKWNSIPWIPSDATYSFFPTRRPPSNDSTNELIDHPTLFKPFQPLFKLEYSWLGSVGHETVPRLLFQTLQHARPTYSAREPVHFQTWRTARIICTLLFKMSVDDFYFQRIFNMEQVYKRRTLRFVDKIVFFKFVLG